MGIFSGCNSKPLAGETYTLTVDTDTSGTRQWSVQYTERGVVSHTVTKRQNEDKTDIVFTGLKPGKVKATVYRAEEGKTPNKADNVYRILLHVDRKGNVTEPSPYYGSYTVDCGQGISGSEWEVECTDGGVHWYAHENRIKQDGDGMQGYTMRYTFTGKRPGASHVLVQTYLPWCDVYEPMRDLWLYVDSEYRVSELKMTDFQSLRLSEQDTSAIHRVIEATKSDDGVRLVSYDETFRWSDEDRDYVSTRQDEVSVDGDEAAYRSVAGLLTECNVEKWDGFSKSDPRVLDGTMFAFEAVLADGKTVQASGSNSYPDGYHALEEMLRSFMDRAQEG